MATPTPRCSQTTSFSMSELCQPRTALLDLALLRRVVRFLCGRMLACSCRGYRRLNAPVSMPLQLPPPQLPGPVGGSGYTGIIEADTANMVSLKISLLGDCHIGKTSFVEKYVGHTQEKAGMKMAGLNLMDKILAVRGAHIAFNIWDVAGDSKSVNHVPIACKGAAAILFMFDLTSRSTLHNILDWYVKARKWNTAAIPILIGTKFDDFVQCPLEMQWAIVSQARAYARAMQATLFFSSTTHNINVNKIFKFVAAKMFNLPWTVERNLTIGEPIIDFQ